MLENIYNKFHREILLSKLLLIEGLKQKENVAINIIAHLIKDIVKLFKLLPSID